jgi:hypothetical protein
MNQNTTTATLTQNDLNRLAADEQDFIRYQDLVLLAEKNGLSVEDALFYAEEHPGHDIIDILLDEEDI